MAKINYLCKTKRYDVSNALHAVMQHDVRFSAAK